MGQVKAQLPLKGYEVLQAAPDHRHSPPDQDPDDDNDWEDLPKQGDHDETANAAGQGGHPDRGLQQDEVPDYDFGNIDFGDETEMPGDAKKYRISTDSKFFLLYQLNAGLWGGASTTVRNSTKIYKGRRMPIIRRSTRRDARECHHWVKQEMRALGPFENLKSEIDALESIKPKARIQVPPSSQVSSQVQYPNGHAYAEPAEGKFRNRYSFPSRLNYRSATKQKQANVGPYNTDGGRIENVVAELNGRMAENRSASCTQWQEWKALLDTAIAEVRSKYPPDITQEQFPAIDLEPPDGAAEDTYAGSGFSVYERKGERNFSLDVWFGGKKHHIANFVYRATAVAAGQEWWHRLGERPIDITNHHAVKNAIHETKRQIRAQCGNGSLRVRTVSF